MRPSDRLFLEMTVDLAAQGRFTCSPNPPVGCVIVKDGRILGRGYHQRAGEGHAEVNALADADARGEDVTGADVFVSLEPCAFVGRTPACASTLVARKVGRVVIALIDPFEKVSGAGVEILRQAGIQVDVAAVQDSADAASLIEGFVSRTQRGRPFVRLKTATSMDGNIALADGSSQWITGPESRADVQYWRARSDAVITGIGTVLADNPQLTVRADHLAHANQPVRVVLDRQLRTPMNFHVVSDGYPTWICHNADHTQGQGEPKEWPESVRLLALSEPDALQDLLAALAEAGCNEVLVEAGAGVCGAFVEQGLWDEWICYIAPKWLGSDAQPVAHFALQKLALAPQGRISSTTHLGNDLRLIVRP